MVIRSKDEKRAKQKNPLEDMPLSDDKAEIVGLESEEAWARLRAKRNALLPAPDLMDLLGFNSLEKIYESDRRHGEYFFLNWIVNKIS